LKALYYYPLRAIGILMMLCVQHEPSAHPAIELEIRQLDRTISANQGNVTLLLRRAELFRLHGQLKEALTDLDAVKHLAPATASLAYHRAILFRDMRRYEEALNLMKGYVAANSTHSEGFLQLSRIQRDMGQINNSIESYRRAIHLVEKPGPDYFVELALIQKSTGDSEGALNTLDDGIRRLGAIVSLQLVALDIEEQAGFFGAALRRIDSLETAGMQEESRLFRRARILLASGRKQEATESCLQARASLQALDRQWLATPANQKLLAEINSLLASSGLKDK
jgi:tetratricopeptide (TPR) repeat protein